MSKKFLGLVLGALFLSPFTINVAESFACDCEAGKKNCKCEDCSGECGSCNNSLISGVSLSCSCGEGASKEGNKDSSSQP